MNRKETYKYYVKTKLDRENDTYTTKVKIKGDYCEALMFALDEVVKALVLDLKIEKKEFIKMFTNAYDKTKESEK